VYLLYSFVTALALVVLSPFFLYQALRHNKYVGSLAQRLGYLPVSFNLDGDDSIWVHAVSVGEVLAARAFITELRRRYPRLRLFLSTTTLTGSSRGGASRTWTRSSIFRSTGDLRPGGP
jgi:3-deoxy-D-manno-octulosonic-acid transferase